MGKRIAAFLVVLVLAFSFQTTVLSDGVFEYEVSDGAVAVEQYKGSSEQVEIPSKTSDGKVTAVLSGAFRGNKEMKSIVIPESIVKIAAKAFAKTCPNPDNVDIFDGVSWLCIVMLLQNLSVTNKNLTLNRI